jgi:hypothetical protein
MPSAPELQAALLPNAERIALAATELVSAASLPALPITLSE